MVKVIQVITLLSSTRVGGPKGSMSEATVRTRDSG